MVRLQVLILTRVGSNPATPEQIIHSFELIAQLVERRADNSQVAGSNPAKLKYYADMAELVDALDLGSSA